MNAGARSFTFCSTSARTSSTASAGINDTWSIHKVPTLSKRIASRASRSATRGVNVNWQRCQPAAGPTISAVRSSYTRPPAVSASSAAPTRPLKPPLRSQNDTRYPTFARTGMRGWYTPCRATTAGFRSMRRERARGLPSRDASGYACVASPANDSP